MKTSTLFVALLLSTVSFVAVSRQIDFRPPDEIQNLTRNDIATIKQLLDSNDSSLMRGSVNEIIRGEIKWDKYREERFVVLTRQFVFEKIVAIDWEKEEAKNLAGHIDRWYRDRFGEFLKEGEDVFTPSPRDTFQDQTNARVMRNVIDGLVVVLELDETTASVLIKDTLVQLFTKPDSAFKKAIRSKILQTAAKHRTSDAVEDVFDYVKEQYLGRLFAEDKSVVATYTLERKYAALDNAKNACLLLLENIPAGLFDRGVALSPNSAASREAEALKAVYPGDSRRDAAVEILDESVDLGFTYRVVLINLIAPSFPNSREQAEGSYPYFIKMSDVYLKLREDKRSTSVYKAGMDHFLNELQERYMQYLSDEQ